MKKYYSLLFCLFLTANLFAAVFTSTDGKVSLELPNGWQFARKPAEGSVLSIVKDTARIDIKKIPNCASETCAEKKTQADLATVKSKNMQVVGNSYTGEDIKRMDFATGESLFYISFFTPKNDFSAGYFWIGNQGYSILAKDLSYAQADLIFSFIAPANQANQAAHVPEGPTSLELDVNSTKAYDIETLPDVQEAEAEIPVLETLKTNTSKHTVTLKKRLSRKFHLWTSLVNPDMPSYIQKMGVGFDLIILLLVLYVLLQIGALIVRVWVLPRKLRKEAEPTSPYPIYFRRRYGTPSLIYRAQDNQGHVFLSLISRWDSLFMFSGILIILGNLILLALLSLLQKTGLTSWSAYTFNTCYSACALIIPLGVLVFLCGFLWSQFVGKNLLVYNQKGQKVVRIIQKGIPLLREQYAVCFIETKQIIWLERVRFSLLHTWKASDQQKQPLFQVKEQSKWMALMRKFTGHLWGFLRASYTLQNTDGTAFGAITNTRSIFNRFIADVDAPQAINASVLLVTALLVNIRDRDKWYPWP